MCLAVPGRIESITGDDFLTKRGKVNFSGIVKEISLACVPEAKVGDYTLVHAGVAISLVDEEEAKEVLSYLKEIDEINQGLDNEIH